MKLSEAILKGCEMRPKGVGGLFTIDGGSCAIGAALEAAGYAAPVAPRSLSWMSDSDLCFLFPEFANVLMSWEQHPAFLDGTTTLVSHIIPDLNDRLGWSREAIAMWVESIEKKMELEAEKSHPKPTEIEKSSPVCENVLDKTSVMCYTSASKETNYDPLVHASRL